MQNSYCKISIGYFFFLLVILLVFGYTPTNDGEGYIELARLSLNDGMPYPTPSSIYGQPFVWNIGYICMVESSLWLFNTIYPILLLNCVLKATTACVIALIAKQLFDEKTGLVAIGLYIIYPNNWGDSTMLMSETPSIALAILALYIILSKDNWKLWLAAGLLFSIANWIRPVSPIYIGSAFLYHLIFNRRHIISHYASLLSTYAAFIIIVGTCSWIRTGFFLYQTDTVWFNMAEATYETSTKPHYNSEVYPKGTIRYIDDRQHKTAPECSSIWKERDLKWLERHKTDYLKKMPGRLFWMYFSDIDNISAFFTHKEHPENNYVTLPYRHLIGQIASLDGIQYIALITWAMYIALLLAATFGLCGMAYHRLWRQAFLLTMIVIGGSLAIVLVTHGETRFKAPLMPFVFIICSSLKYNHIYDKDL